MNKVFVVIPAYNEERKISHVLAELKRDYENIVVVNDDSSDRTREYAEKAGVVVINHPLNRGQGAALETGTQYALKKGADIIVHFDADGQFKVSEIAKIIKPIIESKADIVMGSRFLEIDCKMPFFKKFIIFPLARFILRSFYGASLSDPQNGFRAFSRKVAKNLQIDNDGAAHCTEIIVKTMKSKWKYLEVPVTVSYENFGQGLFSGKGRASGGVKILKSLLLQKLIK